MLILMFDGASHQTADVWFQANSGMPVERTLATNVNGLAQAIASFGASSVNASGTGAGGLTDLTSAATLSQVAVSGMADVLKAFDSNGNILGGSPVVASTTIVPNSDDSIKSVNRGLRNTHGWEVGKNRRKRRGSFSAGGRRPPSLERPLPAGKCI